MRRASKKDFFKTVTIFSLSFLYSLFFVWRNIFMTLLDYTTEDFFKAIYQPASSSVEMNDSAHQSQCKWTHFEAEVSDILAYFTTLSCFCKRPANRYYTLEYGPILECASYDKTKPFYNPRFVCGFHVHELAWLRLLNQLQEGYPICSRYLGLRACPLFNFTYCALFKVYNDYPSIPVSFPTCFCNKPIKMVHDQFKEKQDKLEYIAPTSIKPKIITNLFVQIETFKVLLNVTGWIPRIKVSFQNQSISYILKWMSWLIMHIFVS